MKGKYSLPVVKAVDLIWTSFDRDEMRRGYEMLMKEAQNGDADALCFIARCHMGEEYVWSGAGFATDDENASLLLQKSAIMGSATGVLCAVRCGNLTPTVQRSMPFGSFKEAYEEILEQADRGNAFCQYLIGNVYYWGDYLMVEPELAKQFKDVKEYNAFAYPIAKKYYEQSFNGRITAGWGNYRDILKSGLVDDDPELLEYYFQKLSEVSPVVCCSYGVYLSTEKNDMRGALSCYINAAQRGDMQATLNAGCFYDEGCVVERDLDMAFQFYEIAAIGGEPGAQWQVGYYYFDGWGSVEQDYAKAAHWFHKAYENPKGGSEVRAAAYLAICYQDGLGVVQDYDMAFSYLEEVADSIEELWDPINSMVLNALGVAYAYGLGTEQDIESGRRYFKAAAEMGSEEAVENLRSLEQNGE